MKQTAVEWLVEQLFKTNNNTNDAKKIDVKSIIEQAKEMEEEQKGYSGEEVLELLLKSKIETSNLYYEDMKEWFELNKKK